MNEVQHRLAGARRRQRRVLGTVAAIAVLLVLAGAVAGTFVRFGGELRPIRVDVAPGEAASTAVIEIVEGRGAVWNARVVALPGPLTLRVGAPGFVSETLAPDRQAAARDGVVVILRERQAVLRATATPERAETRWSLDGVAVGTGSALEIEIPAGEHVVGARHPGYVPVSRRLNAERGGTHTVTLPLARVEGRIAITSQPSGAEVTHNGKSAGRTPLSLDVFGGAHALRVAYPGHDARTETLAVTHETPDVERHYRLDPSPARVSFALSPEGGTLTVDGRAVSGAVELAPGVTYRVRYAKPGYASQETEIAPKPGERRTVAMTLDPTFGVVTVHSEPEADIEVDGRIVGRTPKRLRLQTMAQTIRLVRDGYRAETLSVTPDRGAPRRVEVTLRTEAEARLAEAPEQYANSAGIVLRFFRDPGAVTLGTPRGEPGRRANEFVREVKLTRPFFAGVHEVTVGQFRQFTHPGEPPSADRRPVTGIAWEDAARFCNWLSVREGLTPVYRFEGDRHAGSDAGADGYRLATEAEWEWLARKAGRNRQSRFPWGDDTRVPAGSGNLADESARGQVPVYIPRYDDAHPGLAEVGRFAANAAGIHDLAGNASEWVHDFYDVEPPEPGRVETDPMGTRAGGWRTVKGSSWRSGTLSELRAAWRTGSRAPKDDLGFRIARYLVGGP